MISKSDIIIIVAATSALGFGVSRWYDSTRNVSTLTVQASSRTAVSTAGNTRESLTQRTVIEPATNTSQELQSTDIASLNTNVIETELQPVSTTTVATQPEFASYVIESGDSLSKLAVRFGTDVRTLREINSINGSVIHIGDSLRYPL